MYDYIFKLQLKMEQQLNLNQKEIILADDQYSCVIECRCKVQLAETSNVGVATVLLGFDFQVTKQHGSCIIYTITNIEQ